MTYDQNDAYTKVMGPERHVRVRPFLVGRSKLEAETG
jgi:hypothetical protein